MTDPIRAGVYLAPFAFSDLSTYKKRPVCVLSGNEINAGPDVVVAMITSRRQRIERPGIGDVVLRDWAASGLPLASVVRASRIQTLDRSLLVGEVGELSSSDLQAVEDGLRAVLGLV